MPAVPCQNFGDLVVSTLVSEQHWLHSFVTGQIHKFFPVELFYGLPESFSKEREI